MSLLSSIAELATTLAARLLKLKRVVLPPKLEGPVHTYPPEMTRATTFYDLHCCTKCGLFNERRAAYTVPPCAVNGTPIP
jgi:hypothetical protein